MCVCVLCVCACVRACLRSFVRACACMRVCVCAAKYIKRLTKSNKNDNTFVNSGCVLCNTRRRIQTRC